MGAACRIGDPRRGNRSPALSCLPDRGYRRTQAGGGAHRRSGDPLEFRADQRRARRLGPRHAQGRHDLFHDLGEHAGLCGWRNGRRPGSLADDDPSRRPRPGGRSGPGASSRRNAVLRGGVPDASQGWPLDMDPRPRQGDRARQRGKAHQGHRQPDRHHPAQGGRSASHGLGGDAGRREGASQGHPAIDRRRGDLHGCRQPHHLHESGGRKADGRCRRRGAGQDSRPHLLGGRRGNRAADRHGTARGRQPGPHRPEQPRRATKRAAASARSCLRS